jgi:hypothetical protein
VKNPVYFEIIGEIKDIEIIAIGGKNTRYNADSETIWSWLLAQA